MRFPADRKPVPYIYQRWDAFQFGYFITVAYLAFHVMDVNCLAGLTMDSAPFMEYEGIAQNGILVELVPALIGGLFDRLLNRYLSALGLTHSGITGGAGIGVSLASVAAMAGFNGSHSSRCLSWWRLPITSRIVNL